MGLVTIANTSSIQACRELRVGSTFHGPGCSGVVVLSHQQQSVDDFDMSQILLWLSEGSQVILSDSRWFYISVQGVNIKWTYLVLHGSL